MRILSAFIFALLLASPTWAFQVRLCSSDSDCTIIKAPCTGWAPVHVEQKEEVITFFETTPSVGTCKPIQETPQPEAACVEQHCAVKKP